MAKTSVFVDGVQAGQTLRELQKEYKKLKRDILDMKGGTEEFNKAMEELRKKGAQLDGHRRQVKGISDGFGQANTNIKDMLKQFNPLSARFIAMTTAGLGFFSMFKRGLSTISEFESAIDSLGTLTGTKGNALVELKKQVIELSNETGKGSSEIAKAMELVGGANSDLLENKAALADVTKQAILLSQAGGIDVPRAAEALTKSMNQFGAGAKDAGLYIDILNNSQQKGTATIEQLADSMVNAGSTARAFGLSFEQTNALLQGFAKGGTVGSEAGTQLAGILSKLSKAQQAEFNPTMTNAVDVINNLSKANLSYTDLVKLTDAEGAKWLSTLINQNAVVQDLKDGLHEQGTAAKAANDNTDNLAGNTEKAVTAIENYILGSEEANKVSGTLNWIMKEIATNIDGVVRVIGKAIVVWGIYKAVQKTLQLRDAIRDWRDQAAQVDKATGAVKKNADAQKGASSAASGLKGALTSIGWTALISLAAEFASELYDIASGAAQARAEAEALAAARERLTKKTDTRISDSQKKLDKEIAELRRKRNEGIIKSDAELHKKEEEAYTRAKQRLNNQVKDNKQAQVDMTKDIENAKKTVAEYEKKYGTMGGGLAISTLTGNAQTETGNYIAAKSALIKLGAEKKAMTETDKRYADEIDNLNESLKDAASDQKVAGKEAIKTTAELKKEADAAQKLADQLAELREKVQDIASSNSYDSALAQYKEGLDKELFELQHSLDEKYKAEMDEATELAKKKGEVGQEAQELYNRLVQLKEEELGRKTAEIRDRYSKEQFAQEQEQQKNQNLISIAQEKSLQDALIEVKVAQAQKAYEAVLATDKEGKAIAEKELRKVLEEQLEHEKQRKIEALYEQYDEDKIGRKELNARKLQAEQDYLDAVEEMNTKSAEKIKQINSERFEKALNTAQEIIGIASKFSDASAKKEQNKVDKRTAEEESKLKAKLDANLITEEEYNKKKDALDKEADDRKKEIQNEQARRTKAAAIAEAIIQGALAIAKVTAQTGVTAPFAIPLIIASTAAQIATISAENPDQYADGGYTNVVGKKDGLRYRAKNVGKLKGGMTPNSPSLALISEKGNEYFVPNHLMRNQVVANHVAMIEAIRTNQYADGGYTKPNPGTDNSLIGVIERNTQTMDKLNQMIPNIKAVADDKNSAAIVRKANKVDRNRLS